MKSTYKERDIRQCKQMLFDFAQKAARRGMSFDKITLDWHTFESLFGRGITEIDFPTKISGYALTIIRGDLDSYCD